MYLGGKKVKSIGFHHPLFAYPAKEPRDKELLDLLKKGDSDAPKLIAESFMRLILTVVGRYYEQLGRKDDDEIVSAAMLGLSKAIADAPKVMTDDNLGGYIIRRVHSEIANYLRKERHYEELNIDVETPDTNFDPDDWIRDVTKNDMEINILRLRLQGLKNYEIAEQFGVSPAFISQLWTTFKKRYENERESKVGR